MYQRSYWYLKALSQGPLIWKSSHGNSLIITQFTLPGLSRRRGTRFLKSTVCPPSGYLLFDFSGVFFTSGGSLGDGGKFYWVFLKTTDLPSSVLGVYKSAR